MLPVLIGALTAAVGVAAVALSAPSHVQAQFRHETPEGGLTGDAAAGAHPAIPDEAPGDVSGGAADPVELAPPPPPYRALPPGSRLEWSFEPAGGGEAEQIVMRVLAAGPTFMIQTSLAPFDFLTKDYALFLEYKGVGVLDCAEPTGEDEIRATLAETDALWPLRPGVTSGRFSIEADRPVVEDGGPAPDGTRAFVIAEASEEGFVRMHWSPEIGALVEIEWADGGRDLLKELATGVSEASEPDLQPVAGVVPASCRRVLPGWLWERLGVPF